MSLKKRPRKGYRRLAGLRQVRANFAEVLRVH